MKYMDFDTGEVWTEEEIQEVYKAEYELREQYPTFDDYLEHLIDLGKQKVGGIVEIENWYAVQYDHEDADWGTGSYDLEEAKEMCRENGYKLIAVIDISGNNPVCVDEIEM